jgi:hypothetical protein
MNNFEFSILTWPLLATTVLAVIMAFLGWRNRRGAPANLVYALLMAALAEWSFFNALEFAAKDFDGALVSANLQYLGTALAMVWPTPVSWPHASLPAMPPILPRLRRLSPVSTAAR